MNLFPVALKYDELARTSEGRVVIPFAATLSGEFDLNLASLATNRLFSGIRGMFLYASGIHVIGSVDYSIGVVSTGQDIYLSLLQSQSMFGYFPLLATINDTIVFQLHGSGGLVNLQGFLTNFKVKPFATHVNI